MKERFSEMPDEIIDVLCNEVGAAVYAGEYDASLIGREFVHFKGGVIDCWDSLAPRRVRS